MPPDTDTQLAEIKETLARQQKTLDMLVRQQGPDMPGGGRTHWKRMLILAAVILIAGSLMGYKYYLILKSITDQYPS